MLDRSSYAVALDAADISCSHLAGEERILGKIFEITAAERVPVNIHSWSEQDVDPIFQNLISHRRSDFLHKVDIPRTCQQGSYREAGGVECLVRSLPGRADPDSCGTVSQDGSGNSKTFYWPCVAGSTGDLGNHAGGNAFHHRRLCTTYKKSGLFLKRHGLQDFINVVRSELRLGIGEDSRPYECQNGK